MVLDDELDAAGKATELECKRSELKKIAPDISIHSRIIKANVFRRLRDLASISTGAATYMYNLITGDESSASNRAEYERNALALTKLFASAEVPSEVVLDLREHHNSSRRGKSPFEEFWLVVHDVSHSESFVTLLRFAPLRRVDL